MGTPLPKDHDHKISLEAAAALTRRYRQDGKLRSGDSGAFLGKQVQELLAQPGCVGMRIYRARNDEGFDTSVLVGVDEKGDDMVGGILLEFELKCPPFCGDANSLNS